jgi:major membrane immunogen (membrane-anchored lipoprotein)
MKKTFFILIAATLMLASCTKSDKCKCTIKVGDITVDNQIVPRPEESKCSQLKVEDIDGELIDIDLSKLATINCVNYND